MAVSLGYTEGRRAVFPIVTKKLGGTKRVKDSKDLDFIKYVKTYKKIFKIVCKKAKKLQNSDLIKKSDNKTKAAWSLVNKELGIKKNVQNFPDLLVEDKQIENGNKISVLFNNRFSNIPQGLNIVPSKFQAMHLLHTQDHCHQEFSFSFVSCVEVAEIINSLKNKRSAGWDEIPQHLMKITSDTICRPLSFIINKSFGCGEFPSKLKFAEVKPVYKKGGREVLDNYRPISILPCFSKVLEKIASNQIKNYLETNKLFAKEQFGFRSAHNTSLAIANFVDQITSALDGSQSTLGVFCDLAKAFDCVQHDILLEKLKYYNFSESAVSWIKSYLSNRYQRTIIFKNNVKYTSNWNQLKFGVPQGSILGPLLFLLYINDLPVSVSPKLVLYADDTTAILKANSNQDVKEIFQCALAELQNWFSANGLRLNNSKTQIVKFQTAQNKELFEKNISFNENSFPVSKSVNFLGVEIDSQLNWKANISKIIKKLNSICFQMIVLREVIETQTKLMLYYGLFFPIISYAIEFWGMSSQSNLVFKMQKKYIRIMTFSSKRKSCKPFFKELSILTIPSLYIYKCLIYVKNNLENLKEAQHDHQYNTRYCNDFQYPRHRLTLFQKTPQYMGRKLFNKLPGNLKHIINENKFGGELKKFLLGKAFYSVDEFLNG